MDMYWLRLGGLYSWISFILTFSNTLSISSQALVNQTTNATQTPTYSTPNSSIPLSPSCIDKKVWNVCWLKTPPYIFDSPKNKSIVQGILTDAIIKGLEQCRCQVNLNFAIRVHKETELLNCSRNENIDLVIPFPHKKVVNKKSYFQIVTSPAIYLLLNREKIKSKVKANVLIEFSRVWTLAVLTILLAAIFGIIVWSLDSAWNRNQFPPTFCPGALEGVWWSFVTLTTVGYGDKTPKYPMGRIFAIIWMFVGMCMVSLLTATMTKALTSGTIENQRDFHNMKIGILENSYTYEEAVKKGAMTKKFADLKNMYAALDDNTIDGILLDIFVATYVRNNPELFNSNKIFVARVYDIQFSLGFYFGFGMAKHLSSQSDVFTSCMSTVFDIQEGRIDIYAIVEEYIQPQQSVKKSSPYDQFKLEINLFAPDSETFLTGVKVLGVILGILIFCGICWEIFRCRWKKSKNLPKTNGDTIVMSGHNKTTTENIHIMVRKLEEVEKALSKVIEFKDMYERCKEDIDRYNFGITNGNPRGTTNTGYSNAA